MGGTEPFLGKEQAVGIWVNIPCKAVFRNDSAPLNAKLGSRNSVGDEGPCRASGS